MTAAAKSPSGYKLERLYVAEQGYRIVEAASVAESAAPEDRSVTFGWDWLPIGTRRFEVVLEVAVEPIPAAPDRAEVRMVGMFEAQPGPLSVPFSTFIRDNAIAILFPFAREVVSTMTGRGPYGAFHIDPINVVALLGSASIEESTGFKFLQSEPDLARDFGLLQEALPAAHQTPALTSG